MCGDSAESRGSFPPHEIPRWPVQWQSNRAALSVGMIPSAVEHTLDLSPLLRRAARHGTGVHNSILMATRAQR